MKRCAALSCALLAAAAPVCADHHALPLWQLEGDENRVYLLGSVHLLRKSDHPLPAEIYAAYDDAEALVMEVDVDDLDPAEVPKLAAELGHIAGPGSLAELLGTAGYERARTLAAAANIPLEELSHTEPWLAALSIEQLALSRLGFDVSFGLEDHLARRARADSKEILGLETLREQLSLLDELPLDVQRRMLLSTLEDSGELGELMDNMVQAWRVGNLSALESAMLDDMLDLPELYAAVIVRRNRRFAEAISALLDDSDDYLVVIGTLHLIGEDGVPSMLAQRGHRAVQLERAAAQ